jgi:hypothetical protein
MIAIFLNELVNITSSYFKINYYRDVSEYNIRNNCNNIFCEAETARFNLAKNSYKLILPNDNFNSKIYYYALLFIFVTVFLMFLYKFWDYNKKAVEYYSDIDGRIFISYLFIFPYLFTFAVVAMLTVMIARRYAPTDSKGYKKYFVTDDNKSININTILDYSKKVITGLVVIWFVFSIFSNIPIYPSNNFKYGTNLWYISLVYLVALTIILNFMIILSNIAFTFNDSTVIDLDKKSLINKLKNEVSKLKVISKDQLINSLVIELDKEVIDKPYQVYALIKSADITPPTEGNSLDIINDKLSSLITDTSKPFIKYYFIDNDIKEFKAKDHTNKEGGHESPYVEFELGKNKSLSQVRFIHEYINNILPTTSTIVDKFDTTYINNIDNLKKYGDLEYYINKFIEKAQNTKISCSDDTKVDYISKPIECSLLQRFFTDSSMYHIKVDGSHIFTLDDTSKKSIYKNALNPETNIYYDLILKICNFTKYIIRFYLDDELNKIEEDVYDNCLKMYKLFNYIDELPNKYKNMSREKLMEKETINNFIFEYRLYLDVYTTSISAVTKDETDSKIKQLIYDYYIKIHDQTDSDVKSESLTKIEGLKKITKKCYNLIDHNNLNIDFDYNNAMIFSKNINDIFNSNDTLNADTSYNSENTYYQKYFNIAGEDNLSQKYNIGNYDYKNVEEFLFSLFLYVIFFIVFTFIILFLQSDMENYSPFEILGREIVTPFVALFIVVLFIYIFVNFNTKYNLYFIYGVLDSFYKRDLLQYNNIITPFIRLHDIDIQNNRDYTKNYIITNVFASIISNNLNLCNVSYDEDTDKFVENDPVLLKQDNNKQSNNEENLVEEISEQFDRLNDISFLATKEESFKYISDYNEFKTYNSNIYKNIKDKYFGTYFYDSNPQKIYNFVQNLEFPVDGTITNVFNLVSKDNVSKYINSFITKYIGIIFRVIIECEYILEHDEFYDTDKFNKLKDYFYFYTEENNYSMPYKFIIKLNTPDDFNNFINSRAEKNIISNYDHQKTLNEEQENHNPNYNIANHAYSYDPNKLTYADIIANFLKIVSHLKYNYDFLMLRSSTTGGETNLKTHTDIFPPDGEFTTVNEYLNDRIHMNHNMKLLYLITDHTPSPSSQKFIEDAGLIEDTFKNTITKTNFDDSTQKFYSYYMKLKFICNLLKEYDSESGEENINSNYLKNVIKTTYKQINEENIKFKNRSKYIEDYTADNEYEISPITNYSTKSNAIKNITNNANYFTGHGILFNYFANAVLILVIYNLGYN